MKRIIGGIFQWCAILITIAMVLVIPGLAITGSDVDKWTLLCVVLGGIGGSMLCAFLAWLCGVEKTQPHDPHDDDTDRYINI